MRNRRYTPRLDVTHLAAALLIVIYSLVAACASVAEGVTKAFVESGGQMEPLQCDITGPPNQDRTRADRTNDPYPSPRVPAASG
jgi:hypothetical protein